MEYSKSVLANMGLIKTRINRKFEHAAAAERAGGENAEYYRNRANQTPDKDKHAGGNWGPGSDPEADESMRQHRAASKSEEKFDIEKSKTREDTKGDTTQASGDRYRNPKTMTWEKKENPERHVSKHYKMNKRTGNIEVNPHTPFEEDYKKIPANASHEKELKEASMDSFLNKSFENRRAIPELVLEKSREVRTTTPEENAKIDEAIKRRKKFDEGKARAQGAYKEKLKEGAMKRSYTMDEMTAATMLKGHPQAQEIIDMLNKGKKKNESGEEFQDGSEDTIGAEGHEANLRGVDHKTGGGGHPGTSTKNASLEDGDLAKSDDGDDDDEDEGEDTEKSSEGDVEKSDNLADNLPEEFEDEMEEDDTIPAESSKKSIDDFTVEFLVKTMGQEKADEFLKAVIGGRSVDPGQVAKKNTQNPKEEGNVAGGGPLKGQNNPLTNRRINTSALAALKNRLGTGGTPPVRTGAGKSKGESDLEKAKESEPNYTDTDKAQERVESGAVYREQKAKKKIESMKEPGDKSEGEFDLEKGEGGQKQERAEWAKSPEKERKEHMSGKSWSMDFSKSILENMGLEKGSPSVSKKVAGGKATQIRYGADKGEAEGTTGKPESRWSHPKSSEEKRYRFEPKKGEVTVRSRKKGEKEWKEGKPIGVSDESKLKNASAGEDFDLHKALDEILEKKTSR